MDEFLRKMGGRIYARRKQMHLTQEELADKAGMTPQTISTAELGKKRLRPENIVKLATALKVSTDYLLRGQVTSTDRNSLLEKIEKLSPTQYRHLENIINSFLAAIEEEHGN